jgi:hypothetical protein
MDWIHTEIFSHNMRGKQYVDENNLLKPSVFICG